MSNELQQGAERLAGEKPKPMIADLEKMAELIARAAIEAVEGPQGGYYNLNVKDAVADVLATSGWVPPIPQTPEEVATTQATINEDAAGLPDRLLSLSSALDEALSIIRSAQEEVLRTGAETIADVMTPDGVERICHAILRYAICTVATLREQLEEMTRFRDEMVEVELSLRQENEQLLFVRQTLENDLVALRSRVEEVVHRLEHFDFNDADLPIQLAAALRGDSDKQ